jgi:hypothetical protein
MTLPYQRTLSVRAARNFLRRIANPYGGIKRLPVAVRQEASTILRHYPIDSEVTVPGMFAEPYRESDGKRGVSDMSGGTDADNVVLVDPPQGWKWGFPKRWDRAKHPDCREWMISEGYPRELAELNLPCTFTSVTDEC